MDGYFSVAIYFGLVFVITALTLAASALFKWKIGKDTPSKYMPYESGIQTKTDLFRERFTLHHYLVALLFLVFDVEVIFLYPWAVVAKKLGAFGFYEMLFFLFPLFIAFAYVWRKGGLQWE